MPAARTTAWWSRGVPFGRIIGVPVSATPSWFLSVAIITVMAGPVVRDLVPGLSTASAYLVAILMAALLGVSVLAHELGHCVVAKRYGVGVVRVQLFFLGGVSEIARVPRTAREEAAVAGAGPLVSAAGFGVFSALAAVLDDGTVLWLMAIELAIANCIIAVFNLLPALPLDGGRVLRAWLWNRLGRQRGTTIAVAGGYIVAAALVVLAVYDFFLRDQSAILQGVVAMSMAFYIAGGARTEQTAPATPTWPDDFEVARLARPFVRVPAETPIGLAIASAGDRDVLLLGADGVGVAILDQSAARSLAARAPAAPAAQAGHPIGPDTLMLFSDGPAELADQLRRVATTHFLLIGQDGQPQGVVHRSDFPGRPAGQPDPPNLRRQ